MSQTDNGWPARRDLPLRPLVVNGVAFSPGIADDDDVETVLRYVVEQFAARVEPLKSPGCWGFAFRENKNDPDSLSRHSGAIAIDVNAPAHPNGVPTARTFTPSQTAEVHQILAEVDHAVRWGGDYTTTPDAMHFEINTDPATLHAVAERLRDDMFTDDDRQRTKRIEAAQKEQAEALLEFRRAVNIRFKAAQVRDLTLIRQGIKDGKTDDQLVEMLTELTEKESK